MAQVPSWMCCAKVHLAIVLWSDSAQSLPVLCVAVCISRVLQEVACLFDCLACRQERGEGEEGSEEHKSKKKKKHKDKDKEHDKDGEGKEDKEEGEVGEAEGEGAGQRDVPEEGEVAGGEVQGEEGRRGDDGQADV